MKTYENSDFPFMKFSGKFGNLKFLKITKSYCLTEFCASEFHFSVVLKSKKIILSNLSRKIFISDRNIFLSSKNKDQILMCKKTVCSKLFRRSTFKKLIRIIWI